MKKVLVLVLVAALVVPAMAFTTSHSQDIAGGCNTCHTAHNANTTAGAPLWDNDITLVTTGFTLYQGGTTISGSTILCMTCHDGSNAGSSSVASSDLSNMHPVSLEVTAVAGEMQLPTGNVILETTLLEDRIECGSCHDIHTTAATTSVAGALRGTAATICVECHLK